MQNLSDLILFKTEKCQETLCESYRASNHPNQLPEKFADCYDYHNDCDRKRDPFTDLASLTLAYQSIKPSYNRTPDVCLNQVEFLYHPMNYKAAQCTGCPGFFCPYYHTAQEKQKWDGLLKRNLKAESPVSSGLEFNSGKFGRNFDAKEENRENNIENGEKRYIFQEYKMYSDDHKVKLEDTNPFFEVVDDDKNADYTENIKREQRQVAVEKQGPVMSSQIQDDYKLAMELDKQLNGDSLDKEKEEAMRNTQAFLKRNQGMGNNKQVNSVVYMKKEDNNTVRKISYNDNILLEEDSANNKSNEYRDSRGNLSNSDQNDSDLIPNDTAREFKKVHAITEADILRRKFTSSHVPKQAMIPSSTVPFFKGTRVYKYGGKIDIHENRQNEFKCFRTNQYYEELIEKYAPGFLNSRGGTIYLGISDDGKSWGIKLGTLMMQDLVLIFERKFKQFTPPVRPEQYCIEACPVYDKDPKVPLKEQYVLQIVIAQGDPTELYFNDKDNAYIRKQASTIFLTPAAIRDELKARTRKQMARKLVSLLDETGFDECLKRQSVKDLSEIKKLLEQKQSLIDAYLKEDKQEYKELLSKLGLHGFF